MELRELLETVFGYPTFRPCQEEIIRQVMAGDDTLGVLPTGAGKSLCYQIPALLLPRPTIVISPLIALMKDQLDGLPPTLHEKATLLNSSLDAAELERRHEAISEGRKTLIFAAPERLRQQSFLSLLNGLEPSLMVIDEAHCVSVWGHDFRPDYLFIRKALDGLKSAGSPPTLLALTATATAAMQTEIGRELGRELKIISASPFRPNLHMEVRRCSNADDKMRELIAICKETSGAAIVYANSRDRCEELATLLQRRKLSAAYYHAGMEREARRETQERFMLGETRIIVATIAFGMGIDKANVRLVVHFNLPHSLESYTQEAGRAGRDGKPSRCLLLYATTDKGNLTRWMRQEEMKLETVRDVYRAIKERLTQSRFGVMSPDDLQATVFGAQSDAFGNDSRLRVAISLLEKVGLLIRHTDSGRRLQIEMLPAKKTARDELERILSERRRAATLAVETMNAYIESSECRHALLVRHFSQALEPCRTSCDNCLGTRQKPVNSPPPSLNHVSDFGRVILEAAAELPFALSRTSLARVLIGAVNSPVPANRCRNFGKLEGMSLKTLREYMDRLLEEGLLRRSENEEFLLLELTPRGREALQSDAAIIRNPVQNLKPAAPLPERTATINVAIEIPGDVFPTVEEDEDDIFEKLRAWRRIEAQRQEVPPFVIFHDKTLRLLAGARPRSVAALAVIPGIGPRKIELYGKAVLSLLADAPADSDARNED